MTAIRSVDPSGVADGLNQGWAHFPARTGQRVRARRSVHRGFRRAMGAAVALCRAGAAASSKRSGIGSDHTHCRHMAVQLNCNSRSNSRV